MHSLYCVILWVWSFQLRDFLAVHYLICTIISCPSWGEVLEVCVTGCELLKCFEYLLADLRICQQHQKIDCTGMRPPGWCVLIDESWTGVYMLLTMADSSLTVLTSGRCGSWTRQRWATPFCSLRPGECETSSWWVINRYSKIEWVLNTDYFLNRMFIEEAYSGKLS